MHEAAYYKREENKAYIDIYMYSLPKGQTNYHYEYDKLNNVVNGEVISMDKHQSMKGIKAEYHIV